jgi:hypothetical protein
MPALHKPAKHYVQTNGDLPTYKSLKVISFLKLNLRLNPMRIIYSIALLVLLTSQLLIAQTSLVLQPDSSGKDAIVDSYYPTVDNSSSSEFNSSAWTHSGFPETQRSLIDFDYSAIPSGAIIQSAFLTLYNNPNSLNGFQDGKHSHISGSNQSHLLRITQPWMENVNWNNQPTGDTLNGVVLLQDTNSNQAYTLDVTLLVQDRIINPTANFGFMLELDIESYYRCLLFASGDHPNAALHPKLEINYTIPSQVPIINSDFEIYIFPNPVKGNFYIEFKKPFGNVSIKIYDKLGKEIYKEKILNESLLIKEITLNAAAGIYYVAISNSENLFIKKLVLE